MNEPERDAQTGGGPALTTAQHQLRNLVIMAFADGSLGDREVNLVADRCVELGLGERDLENAIAFGLSDSARVNLPDHDEAKHALMVDLIRMMAADGHLAEPEKQLFALVAAKLDIALDEVERIIIDTAKTAGND